MDVQKLLPYVVEIVEKNSEIKEKVSSRGYVALLLRQGRVADAKAYCEKHFYRFAFDIEKLQSAQEGKPLSYEQIGNIFKISRERVRQLMLDVYQQVAIYHFHSLLEEK